VIHRGGDRFGSRQGSPHCLRVAVTGEPSRRAAGRQPICCGIRIRRCRA